MDNKKEPNNGVVYTTDESSVKSVVESLGGIAAKLDKIISSLAGEEQNIEKDEEEPEGSLTEDGSDSEIEQSSSNEQATEDSDSSLEENNQSNDLVELGNDQPESSLSVVEDSEERVTESKSEPKKESFLSIFTTVLLTVLCVLLIFVKFIWLYCVEVEGDSMNATLQTGDYLLVDRLDKVDRGEVVVFTLKEKAYIKRVIAVAGDTVLIENGNVYLKKAEESEFSLVEYAGVIGKTYYSPSDHGKVFELTISENCIFVLGDNRENSTDSRAFGEIDLDYVDGVVHQFFIDKKDGALGKIYKYI